MTSRVLPLVGACLVACVVGCDPVVTVDAADGTDGGAEGSGDDGADSAGPGAGSGGTGGTTPMPSADDDGTGDPGPGPTPDPAPFCGNGVAEEGEACDGTDIKTWEFGPTCATEAGPGYDGVLGCNDDCQLDTSLCTLSCGDGVVNRFEEECDPAADEPISCADWMGPGWVGDVACTTECWIDASVCQQTCGNGVIDEGEACDGEALGDATCEGQGYVGGTLQCDATCQLDVGQCHSCGDGIKAAGEACDGTDFGATTCGTLLPGATGELQCDASCQITTSACTAGAAVMISEIMVVALANPVQSAGEWLELYNPSDAEAFDLLGCQLQGQALFETFEIGQSVLVAPGGFVTLGKGTAAELGFVPDIELPAQTSFLNDGDSIRVLCAGVVFDEVEYGGAAWPSLDPGISIALDPTSMTPVGNDQGLSWCASSDEYAPQLFGTPGAANVCAVAGP